MLLLFLPHILPHPCFSLYPSIPSSLALSFSPSLSLTISQSIAFPLSLAVRSCTRDGVGWESPLSFQPTKRTSRQGGRVASKHACRQADRQASRQAGRQASRQAGRPASRQACADTACRHRDAFGNRHQPSSPPRWPAMGPEGPRWGVGATAGWLVVFAKIPQTT